MEENEKKMYKALKYFMSHDIETVNYERKKKGRDFEVSDDVENRLASNGYIDPGHYNHRTHWHIDHLLTNSGYEKFCELRKIILSLRRREKMS